MGYFAIAPEMYARQGDVSALKSIDEIRPIVAKVPDAQVMSDLDAAVAFAKASGKANVEKLAITGFCWGGRITWLYTAHNKGVKAVVAQLNGPVLGLYGGADTGIPNDTVEKMKAACDAAKKPCEIKIYPDTPHAFHADYRPSYRADAAKDGWAKLTAFLKANGVA
jgi:carboxymethylenebutenolidase